MLLRSVIKHVKTQNWLAVFLDFLIVVVGVFIGIQVANWNDARTEEKRFTAQLESFKEELLLAREDIVTYKDFIHQRLTSVNILRGILADNERDTSERELNALAMSALRTVELYVEFRGYDELSTTGAISRIKQDSLRQQLYTWDTALSRLRSSELVGQKLRDTLTFGPVFDVFAMGNLTQADSRYANMPSAERFTLDVDKLRSNRSLDNALVARAIAETQKLNALEAFSKASEDMIVEIERYAP